jgi:small subunit ribosomal protein S2
MAPFIFAKRGNIHIIDIRQTLKGMLIAKKMLADIVASGKDVVFVGTKRQAQKAVEAVAAKCGMHFVSHRWLGGMLTNFRTVRSRLQRLEQLEAMEADGTLESESKKQASRLKREMRKIKANLDGVRKMSRVPGAVIVVDARKEAIALHEARKLDIATIGIIDTDCDPDAVDVAIPANDDSIRAVDLILNELADAVSVGKTMVTAKQAEPAPRTRRTRSSRAATARADEGGAGASRSRRRPSAAAEPVVQQQDAPAEQKTVTAEAEPEEKKQAVVEVQAEPAAAPEAEVKPAEASPEPAEPDQPSVE